MKGILLSTLLLCGTIAVSGQTSDLRDPDLTPFVEKNSSVLAAEHADLNGDGRRDVVLILQRADAAKDADGFPVRQRPLLVLLRGADGKLAEVKRNERIVMCSECGGIFGDPFDTLEAGRNTFTVNFYGGSNWRWKYAYKFNYSRIDKTWQLVRSDEISYHTANPDKMEHNIYTPPRHFGKIDIADFDPENYLKKKKR